jgi:hypothetical protein
VATYRCISLDLRTGTRIAELPLSDLRYGSKLNDVGECSGTLSFQPIGTAQAATLNAVFNDAVDECRRQLVIERDGVIVWCGIIWLSPYKDNPASREVHAAEDWSYFRKRLITRSVTYTTTDQLTIAQQLILTAQAATGGNINVTVGAEVSGITRDITYNGYELKVVADSIEQLATADSGFDWAIDAAWNTSTGALTKTLRLSYPRRGRNFSQTGFVFEVGRNVSEFNWPSDGTKTANKVWATGNGEGDAMLISSAADANQIQPLSSGGPGYPLLETTFSNKDVATQALLNGLARARLTSTSSPVILPELTVEADMDPVIGSYITGDACRVIVPPGISPRFPTGLDTYRRIIGWEVSVSDNGSETVRLTLGDEPSA